jgi:hypothetical protein
MAPYMLAMVGRMDSGGAMANVGAADEPHIPARAPVGTAARAATSPPGPFKRWLLKGLYQEGPYEPRADVHQRPWWQVMCLTGVDYFSSLGYAPGIAALAAGLLSPLATLILVMITLFGALPMYRRVAQRSPHGDGSVSMLERLLPWWQGKLFVLALIGFVSTGFVITITLSAADAAAHIVENPLAKQFVGGQNVMITLLLIALLGAVFLKGFSEAIGIAVVLVAAYIALNLVVVGDGLLQVLRHQHVVGDWSTALSVRYANPLVMIGFALFLFPKLALGLSGFETGVLVMPLIKGDRNDDPRRPAGRIRNARKLLTGAASIMSFFLLSSSIVTTLLIPQRLFKAGQPANGRALAYLAHQSLGTGFGTAYDISTIAILWFAGASAMAGLLNIVPRYLPRYGMAPDWARATRPLTLVVTAICFLVTLLFHASVDAQAGAYATGVLAVMTSATIAVTLSVSRRRQRLPTIFFGFVAVIFIYTLLNTVISQPEGIKIAATFIAAIVLTSLVSRAMRSTELRTTEVVVDDAARRFIEEAARHGPIRIIANEPNERDEREYRLKELEQREDNHIPAGDPVLFLEITITDASEFAPVLKVRGQEIEGYRVLTARSSAIANSIAAVLLYIRDVTGNRPHIYFSWTEGNPVKHLAEYILFGQGEIAPITREVLRQAEPNPQSRPAIHVG